MLKRLQFLTAGESHGQALACIIDGVPAGLLLSADDIDKDLARRQMGYGRGGRMKIELDHAEILSGVRFGKTLGSPISLFIKNKDWENWKEIMNPEVGARHAVPLQKGTPVTRPRPGHADLSGALKYGHRDLRNILERSSARETAARVAVGAIAKKFLSEFDISIMSYVVEIGGIGSRGELPLARTKTVSSQVNDKKLLSIFKKAEASPVRCPDSAAEKKMIRHIDNAIKNGDSLGGIFEVIVSGMPAGLGSYSQGDSRLDARLAGAIMGIQAMKGVEIGLGFEMTKKPGSEVMDEIFYKAPKSRRAEEQKTSAPRGFLTSGLSGGFYRKTNNAGGIEGGISNGMPIIVRAAMKPIPTLRRPLKSVDINTKKKYRAAYERSDVCAVPAASVIGEAVTAIIIADSFLEKFGGDSIEEIKRNYKGYLKQLREF